MYVLSLQTLIEQSVESFKAHNYSGNILSINEFFSEESIEKLEVQFHGLFAFLAFHPKIDKPIVDYLKAGSLTSDSGDNILVLFILDQSAKWPVPLTQNSLGKWLDVDINLHPSYELIKILFCNNNTPTLPGIAFFEKFTEECEPVFVSLQNLINKEQVCEKLRTIFSIASNIYLRQNGRSNHFVNEFCVDLQKHQIPFTRAGKTSIRIWLFKAFDFIWKNKGDIVSIVKMFR